jgi:HAD superfamily hydrolase (TIGR01509 family)
VLDPIHDPFRGEDPEGAVSPCQGVVFDLDGTLTDNMPLHTEAFERFVERHGLRPWTPELRAELEGRRNRDIFPVVFEREMSDEEIRHFSREKEQMYRELSAGVIRPLPGAVALLDALSAAGIPYGIATSAPEANVEHSLRELGLRDRFEVIRRSDQMPRGKPSPDVFLAVADALGIDPRRALAFEDAPAGLDAARAAGFPTVALATTFSREELARRGYDLPVIDDYREVARGPSTL